ncbi:baculoviral IAP repeat-containing protein 3 isoform X1 [Hyposmocoma kahamanoa]|uniref:baculoviral IAP repeat-containing protein 3 isoform X1 n=2 Tax=Hyposmocoma kahamanoa TaxID=1477025 RepID=UPI000E6D5FEF|nr:baculoviral IAP repeat-containing protein 3 isoform X1 [Hyposmocoma kahamanoa]
MPDTQRTLHLFGNVPPKNPSLAFKTPSFDKTDNHDTFEPINFTPEPVQEVPPQDMRREDERLKTFKNWPVPSVRPEVLAKNGFYYLGRGDEVRCAFCKVEIMKWVEGDDPASDHQRWAPQCPFLKGPSAVEPVGRDECGVRAPPTTTSAIQMPGPVHPKYASQAARLRTFKDWPRCMRQKPEDLADAGFFYTGQGDKTKCFYCDGGLKDWEEDDIPWEQHARWFKRCAFVLLVKGKQFVQKVITESCFIEANEEDTIPPAVKPQEPKKEEAPIEDSKLCQICFSEERNICFVPCGHVVACARCALANSNCPMCRRTIQYAQRLYYPCVTCATHVGGKTLKNQSSTKCQHQSRKSVITLFV